MSKQPKGDEMTKNSLPHDPLWPRAGHWLAPAEKPGDGAPPQAPASGPVDIALVGVPAHRTSLSPTGAHATPAAVRGALLRYSTFSAAHGVDVAALRAIDLGDIEEPDGAEGEARVRSAVAGAAAAGCRLLIAVGGDNSITFPVMSGLFSDAWPECGLVTVDAHHDLRDGVSNGSPVRRLVEAGLPGTHIVQVGIADFTNSPAYAERARDLGITVVPRNRLRTQPAEKVMRDALDIAGQGGRPVFVDLDVDVCDRSVAPGCPASAPGGISADELRRIAFVAGSDPRVAGIDITEVDATADAPDGRTIRLAALLVLEAAAGLATRGAGPTPLIA